VNFIRAAASEVVGLFVGDWAQTAVSIGILALGWLLLSRVHVVGLGFVIVLALAAQLIYATMLEARQTAKRN
jgi:hypothetical protein